MAYRKFKGTNSEYTMLHSWVRKQLGTPQHCVKCLSKSPRRWYDWANISGEYHKDLTDWIRVCRPCHKIMDRNAPLGIRDNYTVCIHGHNLSGSNLYVRPNGVRECRICKRKAKNDSTRRSKLRRLEAMNTPSTMQSGSNPIGEKNGDSYDHSETA